MRMSEMRNTASNVKRLNGKATILDTSNVDFREIMRETSDERIRAKNVNIEEELMT